MVIFKLLSVTSPKSFSIYLSFPSALNRFNVPNTEKLASASLYRLLAPIQLRATENHMLIELNASSRLRSQPCMAMASFSTILSKLLRRSQREINYHETASTQQIIDEPLGNFWNGISTTFISEADDMVLNVDKWLDEPFIPKLCQSMNRNELQARDDESLICTGTAL